MISFLNSKFDKMGFKKFLIAGPALSYLCDILLVIYINKVMLGRLITDQWIYTVIRLKGYEPSAFGLAQIHEFKQAIISSMSFAFMAVLIYNLIIYLCCMKNFNWAKKYVKGYTFTGAALSVVEIAFLLVKTGEVSPITVVAMLGYFVIYLGFRHFHKVQELAESKN